MRNKKVNIAKKMIVGIVLVSTIISLFAGVFLAFTTPEPNNKIPTPIEIEEGNFDEINKNLASNN